MMPAFIMIGSMIIPAISPGCSSKARATASRSLNGTMIVSAMMASGTPELAGTFVGRLAGPTSPASGVTETWTESWCPW